MNKKSGKTGLLVVVMMSVLTMGMFHFSSGADNVQRLLRSAKSKKVEVAPAPLVDDSPINPAIKDSSDDKRRRPPVKKEQPKKRTPRRPRRKNGGPL